MDSQNTNGYIRPFGEVKQTSFSPFDSKEEHFEDRSPRINEEREWEEDFRRRREENDTKPQLQTQSQHKHWYEDYPIEDRRKQLDECIK